MNIAIKKIKIDGYIFDGSDNPYAYDAENQQDITPIANQIEKAIEGGFDTQKILIRGVQSGKHRGIDRDKLIETIMHIGTDLHDQKNDNDTMHAAPFSKDIVTKILQGFHVYKPKCEDRPQLPVDIWLVYCADDFENIEYLHPRHQTIARDKYKRKVKDHSGLRGVLIVN